MTASIRKVYWADGWTRPSDEEMVGYEESLKLMREAHAFFYSAYREEVKSAKNSISFIDGKSRERAIRLLKQTVPIIEKLNKEKKCELGQKMSIAVHVLLRLSCSDFDSRGVLDELKILRSFDNKEVRELTASFKKKQPQLLY